MKKITSIFLLTLILTISGFQESYSAGCNALLPSSGGEGICNDDANTLTFVGAHALSLTLTAITNLTLPTAGTLLSDAGSYANPPWITSLDGAKITGSVPPGGSAGGDLGGTYPNPIVLKTNGVSFAPSATIDATNAANISNGILPSLRLSGNYNNAIAGAAQSIGMLTSSGNADLPLVFVSSPSAGNQVPFLNANLYYHPSTGILTAPTFAGALVGNASTASALTPGATINGVSFTGASNITVPAAASTLTGTTLNSTVTGSSLTSVGTVTSGTWSGSFGAVSGANLTNLTAANISAGTAPISISGNAATASAVNTFGVATPSTFYPVFGASSTSGNQQLNVSNLLSYVPSTGTLTANTFSGSLNGNATSATTAGSAPPSGAAGGDLSGTYPNPTLASIITGSTAGSATNIPVITWDNKGRLTLVSTAPTSGAIIGTANQVLVNGTTGSSQTGAITLTTPQNIGTASNVQFNAQQIGPTQTLAYTPKIAVTGVDSNASTGPSATYTTALDQYPEFQILPFTHSNVSLNFDAFNDGAGWKSSNAVSNWQILKNNQGLVFNFASSVAQGGSVSWTNSLSSDASAGGRWTFSSPLFANGSVTINGGNSALSVGNAALTATNSAETFSGNLADGNYINLGAGGRNLGVYLNGATFLTQNLDYDKTLPGFKYTSNNGGTVILLGNTSGSNRGIGALQHAVSGTTGNTATMVTDLTWSSSGINIPNLGATSIVTTDSSQNLAGVNSSTSYTPTIGDGTNNFTTTTATGNYYKIGHMYFVKIFLVWTNKGSAVAGSVLRVSLPAAVGATSTTPADIGLTQGAGFTGNSFTSFASAGNQYIQFSGMTNAGAQSNVTVSQFAASGQIQLSITYWDN